jgi:hypothetical protein
MLSEVRRVGVWRAGKVGAVMYGLLGLILFPFAMMAALSDSRQGPAMIMVVALYPIIGLVGCLLGALLYNLTAKIAGGFRFDYAPVAPLNPGSGCPAPQNGGYDPR